MTLEISEHPTQHNQAYPSPYSVNNETSSAFMILPGVGDENRHLGVLVEDLLYATVVHTPTKIPMTRRLGIVRPIILLVAKVILMGQVIGRILARRVTGGRGRGGLAVKEGYTAIIISNHTIKLKQRSGNTDGQKERLNAANPTNEARCRKHRTGCCPRRST